jgi:hypothetical protein
MEGTHRISKFQNSKNGWPSALKILQSHRTKNVSNKCPHLLSIGSFHVKQAKIKQKCHPGSRISKLIFFVDSTFNSKEKSHITFFSTPKKFFPKFFCSRGCSDRRIFWKIILQHKIIFCTSSNSFAPNQYFRSGKNIDASRRISSSVVNSSSACKDVL